MRPGDGPAGPVPERTDRAWPDRLTSTFVLLGATTKDGVLPSTATSINRGQCQARMACSPYRRAALTPPGVTIVRRADSRVPVQPGSTGRQALHRLLAADPRLEPLFPTVLLDLQVSTGERIDIGWLLAAWLGRAAAAGRTGHGPE